MFSKLFEHSKQKDTKIEGVEQTPVEQAPIKYIMFYKDERGEIHDFNLLDDEMFDKVMSNPNNAFVLKVIKGKRS